MPLFAKAEKPAVQLFLISFLALYFELIVIRWLSSEVRVFAYLKNVPLIASFLGLGLGCACARVKKDYFRYFPYCMGILCLLVAFSGQLGITFLPFPIADYLIVGDVTGGFDYATLSSKVLALGKFLLVVVAIFALNVGVFLALGQKMGQLLEKLEPLPAYTINIAGSLAGVLAFSVISFAGWPPLAWFALGFFLLAAFLQKNKSASLAYLVILVSIAIVPKQALWSPYYRIDVTPMRADEGNPSSPIVGHNLNVNHDYHQRMMNLSEGSVETRFTAQAQALLQSDLSFRAPGIGAGGWRRIWKRRG